MPKKRSPVVESALFVRLPSHSLDKLDRAANTLGIAKKELVEGLVAKYVDPDSRRGLSSLSRLAQSEPPKARDAQRVLPGLHEFRANEPPEVLSPQQAAELLQLDEDVVVRLAQSGEIPGRKLGEVWRFSRTALIAFLSAPAAKR
jgi:excisionase family DNA binding protein